jgi:AmmeMemoRadiSam system protein B/AmmeMemoRadiSam system protein A
MKPQHTFLYLALLLTVAACGEPQPQTLNSPEPATRLREAKYAGSWYPAEPQLLRKEIESRLAAQAPRAASPPVIAMIGPHAGLRYSGSVGAAGYAALRRQKVSRAFLLGPSHRLPFAGIALPAEDVRAYATPLGDLVIDHEAVAALRGQPGFAGPSEAHDGEHSLEMHAIFIAAVHPGTQLVPLVVGHLRDAGNARALAAGLRSLLRPDDVVIASSDFTHYGPNYGYVPFDEQVPEHLEELLQQARRPLLSADLDGFDSHLSSTDDTICGRGPIRLLLALLPEDASGRSVAADTSGRMVGDYSNSVSYMTLLYRRGDGWPQGRGPGGDLQLKQGPEVLDAAGRQLALHMARKTLRAYLKSGRVLDDEELGVPASGPWREPYGVFVTLKKDGALRGCIGHIFPIQPLWRDIRDNAIAAAVRDGRFTPVAAEELDELQLEISVLTHPAAIPGPHDFEVGRHGVVLEARGRRAVFLPQVAPEQGWDRATTLSHLARKAGLSIDVWRTPAARLSVFEAQVFAEPLSEQWATLQRLEPAQRTTRART